METTLNIHTDVMEQIVIAAQYHCISCPEMIMLLMKKVTGDIGNPKCLGKMVKYQSRQKPENWHKVHVRPREDMYEYWLDLRKLLKMSVSLILAYAVKRYLNKLLKINNADNYLCKNYIITKEVIEETIIWKFIWGYPPKLEKFI
jgi:hypothetical protein